MMGKLVTLSEMFFYGLIKQMHPLWSKTQPCCAASFGALFAAFFNDGPQTHRGLQTGIGHVAHRGSGLSVLVTDRLAMMGQGLHQSA